jgi:hypothetical protein
MTFYKFGNSIINLKNVLSIQKYVSWYAYSIKFVTGKGNTLNNCDIRHHGVGFETEKERDKVFDDLYNELRISSYNDKKNNNE